MNKKLKARVFVAILGLALISGPMFVACKNTSNEKVADAKINMVMHKNDEAKLQENYARGINVDEKERKLQENYARGNIHVNEKEMKLQAPVRAREIRERVGDLAKMQKIRANRANIESKIHMLERER